LKIDGERAFFSPPRVFSKYSGIVDKAAFDRFRTAFAEAPNITVYLHANVTRIRQAARGGAVEGLDVACLEGGRHTAVAGRYVLAVGGIENARLLLVSDIGNRHDLVGRFFQGHVTYSMGEGEDRSMTHFSGGHPLGLYFSTARRAAHSVFAPTLAEQKRRRTGNFTVTSYPSDQESAGATLAIRQAATRLDTGGKAGAGEVMECFVMAEHFPNPDSRVTLSADKDALGMPRVRLDWTYSAADLDGLEGNAAAFGDALGADGKGRFCWPVPRDTLVAISSASRHHMGTTRMHADPRKGVVDPDGRVHGTANLYVAGSSVFPTSGIANPTLTLMALTIRMADHLKQGARA
jgi:choline dehydrogenase-like flavoprotein